MEFSKQSKQQLNVEAKHNFSEKLFNYYLAGPKPNLGHYQRGSLTQMMLISASVYWSSLSEVSSESLGKSPVGFELPTYVLTQ